MVQERQVPKIDVDDLTKKLLAGGEGEIADSRDPSVAVKITVDGDKVEVIEAGGFPKYGYKLKGTAAEKANILQHVVNCYGTIVEKREPKPKSEPKKKTSAKKK